VRERVKKYLPEKFDREFLISLVDNFYLCYKYIYEKSTNFIHGDFVDRNILVNGELNLIDFENSRIAPLVEDLIFFIENSKLENPQKKELISQYKKEIDFDEKIFLILTLLTKLRILGSLLRIKKDNLEKINERIEDSINEIKEITIKLNEQYEISLIKKLHES
jgi:Ser/Thr protein kinase RdoA (MazF antagonist)